MYTVVFRCSRFINHYKIPLSPIKLHIPLTLSLDVHLNLGGRNLRNEERATKALSIMGFNAEMVWFRMIWQCPFFKEPCIAMYLRNWLSKSHRCYFRSVRCFGQHHAPAILKPMRHPSKCVSWDAFSWSTLVGFCWVFVLTCCGF